jgi:hypothetical protein
MLVLKEMSKQGFAKTMLDFCNTVTKSVLISLSSKKNIDIAWFCSTEGVLTCKVFIRKYLLKCWEFYTLNDKSEVSDCLDILKSTGSFHHNECLFDFILIVVYEQVKKVCFIMRRDRMTIDTDDGNCTILTLCLLLIAPQIEKALSTCKYGCLENCNKQQQSIN